MKLEMNTRGNGACPLCVSEGNCRVKTTLVEAAAGMDAAGGEALEIVVYSCPRFREKA